MTTNNRILHVGPATLLKDPQHNLIATTIPSPSNSIPLFPYEVSWKYHRRVIYAADERVAQSFGYHLFKSSHPRDPVKRHLIRVVRP